MCGRHAHADPVGLSRGNGSHQPDGGRTVGDTVRHGQPLSLCIANTDRKRDCVRCAHG
jgi:hypothetical protein